LPRFRSQAFSASQRLPGPLGLRGLVSCRNRSWGPPFRAFPSRRSPAPLEAACSLAVIHRRAERPDCRRLRPGFLRRPRPRAVAGFPRGLRSSFRAPRRSPSRSPRTTTPRSSFPSASPASEPSSPRESVAPRPPKWTQSLAALLGFRPSRVPRLASDPRPVRALAGAHAAHARRRVRATRRTSSPLRRVGPVRRRSARWIPSAGSGPLRTGLRRPSAACPSPLTSQ
jgi:hypothetical protein